MKSIIIKLGGSVLTNHEAYERHAHIIQDIARRHVDTRIYVLVSAQKGHTDRLIQHAAASSSDEQKLRQALKGEVAFPHYDQPHIASQLIQGEIASARKLHALMPNSALLVQDKHFPVVAHASYLRGDIDLEQSHARAHVLNTGAQITVVSGFGGVTLQGKPILLGRNASDLVAAMLARLTQAEQLIYCKDVEYVYKNYGTPQQQRIEVMRHPEAKKFDFGKVLDQRILELVAGLSIHIKIGHHCNIHELLNPSSRCGTTILMEEEQLG